MKTIKKFRKNDWSEEVVNERKHPGQKRYNRALRTLDIDYLADHDEDY